MEIAHASRTQHGRGQWMVLEQTDLMAQRDVATVRPAGPWMQVDAQRAQLALDAHAQAAKLRQY